MKTKWFLLGCLVSFIILILFVFLSIYSLGKLGKKYSKMEITKIKPDSYLHLKLTGEINEYNEYYNIFFRDISLSSHEIIQKINFASNDDNIKGIILEPQFISCGYAVLNEIKQAIKNFRYNGKEVHAYLKIAADKDYLLASAADHIYLNPSASAGIFLSGIGSNILFYKDLFDKIGIKVTVIRAGDYKGGGENYTRTSLSESVRKNIDLLFSNLYDTMIIDLAQDRNCSLEDIKYIYEKRDELFINQELGLKYNLVDELIFKEDLFIRLNITKSRLIPLNKYRISPEIKFTNEEIAVIYTQGEIAPLDFSYDLPNLTSRKLNNILDKLQKDKDVKAIVLRINSPGGSALESEIIYDKILKLQQTKPVVISMSNVAASGGYYISAPGDFIFADPYTITGSIGVYALLFNITQLSEKIGITSDQISKGKYVNALDPFMEPDEKIIESFRGSVESTYNEFKTRVANSRKMSLEDVENIAKGQVWSSKDALNKNLVDDIGMLHNAIFKAAELADLTDYKLRYYPKKKNLLQEILKEQFAMDLMTKLIKKNFQNDLNIVRLVKIFNNIKNDPVQAIMLYEIKN